MSPANAIYLAGLLLLLVGERFLSGAPGLPAMSSAAGALAVLVAVALRTVGWRKVLAEEGARAGQISAAQRAWIFTLVGAAALAMYALTKPAAMGMLGIEVPDGGMGPAEPGARWLGVWGALWPLTLAVATLPLLALDRAMRVAGSRIPKRRVDDVSANALAAALAVGLAFPINYLGTETNVTRDLSYFQTTKVGTATRALVETLERPVDVRIWQAPTSDVTPELEGYFAGLEGERFHVEVLDHAAHPGLAQALQIPGNGWISFTIGTPELGGDEEATATSETPPVVTDKFNVGEELDKSRKTLRRLDEEVQEILHELGRGPRIAYVVQGHGELTWAGKPTEDRNAKGMRSVLQFLGFQVRLVEDLGWLTAGVPEDATLVLILGPDGPYNTPEVESLRDYLQRGGSLFIALEPSIGRMRPKLAPGTRDALHDLLADLGLRLGPGVVAQEVATQPLFGNKLDRTNILTNRYSVHPAVETLMQTKPSDPLLLLQSGWIDELAESELPETVLHGQRTALVRTLEVAWGDLDGQLNFDAGREARQALSVAYVVEGESSDAAPAYRVLVTADSGLISDAGLRSRGNAQFAADAMLWLIGAESMAGSTESEEDIKIEHSKEGQTLWFYGTTVLVPVLLLGLGLVRLRLRRRSATGGGR